MSRRASSSAPPFTDAVVIRCAQPEDERALARLAALDSRRPLTGRVLVAERDGRVLAALAGDGRAVADPFAPTTDLVALLRVRAAPTASRAGRRRDLLRWSGASIRRRPALVRG